MPADLTGDFIDATLFMGMHAKNDAVRAVSKAFFAGRITGRVLMSWEQVGRCDDLVWGFTREVQDAYYPFMDVLHTDMAIARIGYEEEDVRRAFTTPGLEGLPSHERLLVAQVMRRGGLLHTVSPRLRDRGDLPVARLEVPEHGAVFPAELERLYQDSLVLTVASEEL